jgi:hypothetical protein
MANCFDAHRIDMAKKASNQAVVHEGQVLRALPTPRIKLATIEDCRREMARIYRDAKAGKTETADASRLVYMLTAIAKMIEAGQIEAHSTAMKTNASKCRTLADFYGGGRIEKIQRSEADLV